ncbi:hypothetical protein L9F63_022116, partial [Diploptera punctata]
MNLVGKFDIYSEISPVIWTMKIFGICNYSLKGNLSFREIKQCSVTYAYCLILLILHICIIFFYVKDSMSEEVALGPVEYKMFAHLFVTCSALSVIVRASSVFRRFNIDAVYNALADFDCKMSYDHKNYKICYVFSIVLITQHYINFVYVLHRVILSEVLNSVLLSVALFNHWPFITVDILYLSILLAMQWRYRVLNLKIQKSLQSDSLKYSVSMLNSTHGNELKSVSIPILRDLYYSLTHICKLMNSSFSIPILLSITCKFIILTFNLHILLSRSLRNESVLDAIEAEVVINSVNYSSIIVLITWFTTVTTSE